MARRAGIARHVTPHTLRHTFATHLLRKTGNPELVRKALRHARITTTAQIYFHLVASDVEEAVRGLRGFSEPYAIAQAVVDALPDKVRKALESLLLSGRQ